MIVVLLGAAIPVLAFITGFLAILSVLPTKNVLKLQLEQLQSYDPAKRDSTQIPFVDNFLTDVRRRALSNQFAEAGWYTMTPAKFTLRILASACFGLVLSLLFWKMLGFPVTWLIPMIALVVACAGYSPFFALNRAMEGRKVEIQKALPEFLDMVASTVQAGLALNAALAYAVEVAPGALGEEISEALSQIRLGRPRADALKAVGERTNQPELRNALRAMVQAERMGANVATMLNDLASDARHRRLMAVEEMAAKLPVKMVFPMVTCMIPAIFVIIFGSVAANFFAHNRP
jgi:tight adherence protein C